MSWDWYTSALVGVGLLFVAVIIVIAISAIGNSGTTEQQLIQNHTYAFIKTTPDGVVLHCVTNEDLSAIACKR